MKRLILIAIAFITMSAVYAQDKTDKADKKQARKEQRAKADAEYDKMVGEWVTNRDFRFFPQTMQQGSSKTTAVNGRFSVNIAGDKLDVELPTIIGNGAVKYNKLLRFSSIVVLDYEVSKTDNGYRVYFKSDAYNGNEYRFTFSIDTQTKTTKLELSQPVKQSVMYVGSIREK